MMKGLEEFCLLGCEQGLVDQGYHNKLCLSIHVSFYPTLIFKWKILNSLTNLFTYSFTIL